MYISCTYHDFYPQLPHCLIFSFHPTEPATSGAVISPFLTAESANPSGGTTTYSPPTFINLITEESPDVPMPYSYGTQRSNSMDDNSSIPSSEAATDHDVSLDSLTGHAECSSVDKPKPKRKKRRRCRQCENCLIPACNRCRYCL